MKKHIIAHRIVSVLVLMCVIVVELISISVAPLNTVYGASSVKGEGYTDHAHTWYPIGMNDDCSGCKATSGYTDCSKCSHTGKVTCTFCEGRGYIVNYSIYTEEDIYFEDRYDGCSKCGGSGYYYYYYFTDRDEEGILTTSNYSTGTGEISCSSCGGDGSLSTKCSKCNGTGVNYKCTNSQCTLRNTDVSSTYLWNNWASKLGSMSTAFLVCYTTENTYTIEFNGNGATSGSMSSLTSCYYDNSYTLTSNTFKKTGYTFQGWSTSSSATNKTYSDGQSVSKLSATDGATVTLYAVWSANTYTITLNNQAAETAGTTAYYVKYNSGNYSNSGTTTSISQIAIPTKTGYTFCGYYTGTNGTGTCYVNSSGTITSSKTTFAANTTLYAYWKKNTYTITLNNQSATTTGTTVFYEKYATGYYSNSGCTTSISSITRPTRIGFSFGGYFTSANGKGTSYINNSGSITSSNTAFIDNTTLYAYWIPIEYEVEYDPNGGTTGYDYGYYYYQDDVDLSLTASKNGYMFIGWNTDPNATSALTSLSMPAEDIVLYAIYTIPVSDVANHDYPEYEQLKEKEVYFIVWETNNEANCKMYPLTYTKDVSTMVYNYELNSTDISSFVNSLSSYEYAVIAYDNAGNYEVLYGGRAPIFVEYLQTVIHLIYDPILGDWRNYGTSSEGITVGTKFNPEDYIMTITGYTVYSLDEAYVVTEPKTSYIYYIPSEYTLKFDENGGTCDISSKTVTYNDYIGLLPSQKNTYREGYTFAGWNTKEDGSGVSVKSSDLYLIDGDSTIYAQWAVNSYKVEYNYARNLGEYMDPVDPTDLFVKYGVEVNLNYKAYKNGWDFVGWSLNPDGQVKLKSLIMGISAEYEDGTIIDLTPGDITVYAIYNKAITYTFIDIDCERICPELPNPIWNRETQVSMTTPELHTNGEWNPLGWSISKEAASGISITANASYQSAENVTFYGVYEKEIAVTIDSGNPNNVIKGITADIRYNASGDITKIEIILPDAGTQNNKSFDYWEVVGDDTRYKKGDTITTSDTITIIGHWDTYPTIYANNKYYTLAQANDGTTITYDQLLSYATATDKEDDLAGIPVDVKIEGYYADEFANLTNSAEIQLTYVATDSFGNTAKRAIIVYIVNSQVQTDSKTSSTRFIGKEYFNTSNPNIFVDEADGGLRNTSLWKTDLEYSNLLTTTLANTKLNVEYKEISFGLFTQTVEIPSSGNWEREYGRYMFTRDKIEEIKEYVKSNGFSRYQSADATTNFINQFMN